MARVKKSSRKGKLEKKKFVLRENGVRPELITMVEKGHADPWKERGFYYGRFTLF